MFLWQSTSTLGSLAALLRQFERMVEGRAAGDAERAGPAPVRPALGPERAPSRRASY